LIDIALGEVGYLEKKTPENLYSKTGNAGKGNYTKYAEEMSRIHAGIYANGFAWCDTFVDWCMVSAYGVNALSLVHGWSAYTPTSAQYFKNYGQWHKSPVRGDIIFFKDQSGIICHTGIVYEVDERYVYTVEGNTSFATGVVANGGAVAKKSYRRDNSRIAGYGRPDYSLVQIKQKEVEKMYNKLEECPMWAQDYIKLALDRGYIQGDGSGALALDDTRIWCLVVMLRISGIIK